MAVCWIVLARILCNDSTCCSCTSHAPCVHDRPHVCFFAGGDFSGRFCVFVFGVRSSFSRCRRLQIKTIFFKLLGVWLPD